MVHKSRVLIRPSCGVTLIQIQMDGSFKRRKRRKVVERKREESEWHVPLSASLHLHHSNSINHHWGIKQYTCSISLPVLPDIYTQCMYHFQKLLGLVLISYLTPTDRYSIFIISTFPPSTVLTYSYCFVSCFIRHSPVVSCQLATLATYIHFLHNHKVLLCVASQWPSEGNGVRWTSPSTNSSSRPPYCQLLWIWRLHLCP